jgi:DNA-directed RNA polymerase I subunit RPA1
LAESHHVAAINPLSRDEGANGAGEDDTGEQSFPAEGIAEFIVRMENYVNHQLKAAAKVGGVRDEYKDGLVYEERKKVLSEFAKKTYAKCNRCMA